MYNIWRLLFSDKAIRYKVVVSIIDNQFIWADLVCRSTATLYLCCLFGMVDYGGQFSYHQKKQILRSLARASEARGTDASGIAYCAGGVLQVYKRPLPGHKLKIRVPGQVKAVMGHTKLTTQGNERKNQNNHPFLGKAGNVAFALAHNGIIYNDKILRRKYHLPKTEIETDSYIAVQLLEQSRELSSDSLGKMAEEMEGSLCAVPTGDSSCCRPTWASTGEWCWARRGRRPETRSRLPVVPQSSVYCPAGSRPMACTPSSGTTLPIISFIRSHFVFFDYEQPPVLYFLDLLAMMGLWIALPYYLGKALRNRAGRTSHQSQIWEEDIP